MIDGIPAVVGLTPTVATALAMLYLIFTGRVVVRRQHDTIVGIMEKRIDDAVKDRDGWRASSDRKGETIAVLSRSNNELMEAAKFSNHVMTTLQQGGSETA